MSDEWWVTSDEWWKLSDEKYASKHGPSFLPFLFGCEDGKVEKWKTFVWLIRKMRGWKNEVGINI